MSLLHRRTGRRGLFVVVSLLMGLLVGAGPSPAAGAAPISFGSPHTISVGVADRNLEAVRDQISAAVGASFGAIQSLTRTVTFASGKTKPIGFRRVTTTRGTPFVEVISSSDGAPWGVRLLGSATNVTTAVWAVDDLQAAEAQLAAAGTKFLARVPGELAYYQGVDGQLLEVAVRSLLADPATANVNLPAPGVTDLGRMHHFSRSVRPADHAAAVAQLAAAVGMQWGPHQAFSGNVYDRPPGSTVIVDHPDQQFSAQGTHSRPYYDLISADPSIEPWNARRDFSPASLTWATSDLAGARAQLEAAGMTVVVSLDVDIAGFYTGTALIYFHGLGNLDIQLLFAAFAPPP
jgi:hypothetical protein